MLLIFTNITSSLCSFLVLNITRKARRVSFFLNIKGLLNIKVNAKKSVAFLLAVSVILDCLELVLGMHQVYNTANTIITKKTRQVTSFLPAAFQQVLFWWS